MTPLPARLRWYTASNGLLTSCVYSLAMTPTATMIVTQTTTPKNAHRYRERDYKITPGHVITTPSVPKSRGCRCYDHDLI